MGVTFTRSKTNLTCPKCNQPLVVTRCRQERRVTYCVNCDDYECPKAVQTGWYFTKEDAIKAAKDGWWR